MLACSFTYISLLNFLICRPNRHIPWNDDHIPIRLSFYQQMKVSVIYNVLNRKPFHLSVQNSKPDTQPYQ